jgi:hypothetical protein
MGTGAGPVPSMPPVVLPLCSECGEEMPQMSLFMWHVEGWLIVSTYCPACRVILSTQTVPFAPPAGSGEPSRIHQPS